MTVRIEKHATLMTNGLSRRVGWKEDGRERERGVGTRKGGHLLTKARGKGCLELETDRRPS